MPFYEYQAVDVDKSCKHCVDIFEVMHSITSDPLTVCPECNNPIVRLISQISGVIWKGRQANQYNDIKQAKYWRDKDGNKWKVGHGDGSVNSPTVPNRRKRSDEEVSKIVKRQKQAAKRKRNQDSYNRFVRKAKKSK